MKTVIGILLVLVIGAAGGAVFVTTGVFNVSAVYQDPKPIHWLVTKVREYSIERRAEPIAVPDLAEHDMVASGASAYGEMCAGCHGAPGRDPFVGARDMNPPPPDLAELVTEQEPGELFWAIKNGIRMTGMPAWGQTHSDEEIWQLVAFVDELPGLTAADFRKLQREAAGDGHAHDHGHAETGHGDADAGHEDPEHSH
jgi:mono/diheme cytochrome c family protein